MACRVRRIGMNLFYDTRDRVAARPGSNPGTGRVV